MTDAESLLRMIWDAPYDDGPRLVYADWLEEQGEADRAEIIRVQIELSRVRADEPLYASLKRREGQLRKLCPGWMKRLPQSTTNDRYGRALVTAVFDRGFPVPFFRTSAEGFLVMPEDVLAAAPLWKIQIAGGRDFVRELAASPIMQRVKELGLSNCELTDQDVRDLAQSSHFVHLTRLDLTWNELGSPAAEALVNSPFFPRLERLDVRWNQMDVNGLKRLWEKFGEIAHVSPQQ